MKTSSVMSAQEFRATLPHFTGTEQYHQHLLPTGSSILLTDGCAFVREHAGGGAYWLFDLLLSYQTKLKDYPFQVWKLNKLPEDSAVIKCSDGNDKLLVCQDIPYTDFPLDHFELWLVDGVALLPSEY